MLRIARWRSGASNLHLEGRGCATPPEARKSAVLDLGHSRTKERTRLGLEVRDCQVPKTGLDKLRFALRFRICSTAAPMRRTGKAAPRGGLPSHNGDALSWGWSSCRLPASLGRLPDTADACRPPAREHSADDSCRLTGPAAATGPGSGVRYSAGSCCRSCRTTFLDARNWSGLIAVNLRH